MATLSSHIELAGHKSAPPTMTEGASVLSVLAGFFLLNLFTYNLYPQVWCDEVWFSEPAVNWVREGIFHTRGFMFQPPHTFPVINCPLYMMLQVPWLSVAGTSVAAIRSFNYALMTVAAFLSWTALWRFNLVTNAPRRLLVITVLYLGYGMSYAYRCSRPDILGMISLLLLLLSFGIRRPAARLAALFFVSVVTVWIGLQVALCAGVACFGGWVILRKVTFGELCVVAAGLLAGAASLAGFLWGEGVLMYFLPPIIGTLGHSYSQPAVPLALKAKGLLSLIVKSYVDDFSTDLLVAGLAITAIAGWGSLKPGTRRLAVFSLGMALGLPVLFTAVGHWAFYYSYMRFLPVACSFFVMYEDLASRASGRPRWLSLAFGATVLLAALAGLPLRLGLVVAKCRLAPRLEILRTIQASVKPGDVVLSDHAAFFETRQVATEVYDRNYSGVLGHMWKTGGHDFSPEERERMSILIVRPEEAKTFTAHFGGAWEPVGTPFGDTQDFSTLSRIPIVGSRFASYAVQPQNERYQLQIFRRTSSSAAPASR